MIEIILFVTACLVWQAIKEAIRGPRRTSVRFSRPGEIITPDRRIQGKAKCGCKIVDGQVFGKCQAHAMIFETSGGK